MIETVNLREELNEALKAHAAWKMRLRNAALKKEHDLPVQDIKRNDQCRFGKWLNTLPAELKGQGEAKDIDHLHTAFHVQAGKVAELISEGKYDTALAALDEAGYSDASQKLTKAVTRWKVAVM